MQMFDPKENLAQVRHWRAQIQGNGTGVCTLVIGHGVTLSRPAIGRMLLTFSENPGTFVGIGSDAFRDNTSQANVKGWTCTGGVLVNTNGVFSLEVDFWSSTFAAVDLAATSFLDLDLVFSELKTP